MTRDHTRSLLATLPRERLLRMAEAGNMTVECMSALHRNGSNLVLEVIKGQGEFTEWQHYPLDDVNDSESHAQYYFHAHPPDDRVDPDYGHFHTFMRRQGMPSGISPAPVPDFKASSVEHDHVCHLIGISMSRTGLPERLFTTNRWVTDETWYRAADVIAMLDRFAIKTWSSSRLLNQWLTAMFVLYRPQIEQSLIARDRVIEVWQSMHPDQNVFEDRRLEVTSKVDICLQTQLEVLDQLLDDQATTGASLVST